MARRTYIRRATVKPNEGNVSVCDKLRRYLFGSARNVQFIQADAKDRAQDSIDRMAEDLRITQTRYPELLQCSKVCFTMLVTMG